MDSNLTKGDRHTALRCANHTGWRFLTKPVPLERSTGGAKANKVHFHLACTLLNLARSMHFQQEAMAGEMVAVEFGVEL